MFTVLVLTAAVQVMSYADLVAEGQTIGRMGAGANVCRSVGYAGDELVAEHAANRFSQRAVKAGWTPEEISNAVEFGVQAEHRTLRLEALDAADTPETFRQYVEEAAAHLQQRCRELGDQYPGLIGGFEAGDRAMRSRLIEALRNLYEPPLG